MTTREAQQISDLAPTPVTATNADQVKGGFLEGDPDQPIIVGRTRLR
jgi:hypothetical protein